MGRREKRSSSPFPRLDYDRCFIGSDEFAVICGILLLAIGAWVHYTMEECYNRAPNSGVVYHLAVWGPLLGQHVLCR